MDAGLPYWSHDEQRDWKHAVIAGRRILQAHAASCRRPLRLNKLLRAGAYRFRASPGLVAFPHPFGAAAPADRLRAVTALDSGPAPGPYISPAASPNAAYCNLVDPRRGVIVCADNDRTADASRRLHLSDVLFESYARAAVAAAEAPEEAPSPNGSLTNDKSQADPQPPRRRRSLLPWPPLQLDPKLRAILQPGLLPPLRRVVRAQVLTPSTLRVLDLVHRRRGAPPTELQRFEPGPNGAAVTAAGAPAEEFSALAGTVHVAGILHLLRDYAGWARRRRLVRIWTLYAAEGDWSPGWYMLLEIE